MEGVNFGDGKIVSVGNGYEVKFFFTDHLGSVRAVVDAATGEVEERNDFYPFGRRHNISGYPVSDNRFLYNGKEKQTTGNVNYLDYGARMYDVDLGRWFTQDLLAEKYYNLASRQLR